MDSNHLPLQTTNARRMKAWRGLTGALPRLLLVFALTLLLGTFAGCGGTDGSQSGGTGGISAHVVWPQTSGSLRAAIGRYTSHAIPTNVAWVRLTVSDAGATFAPMSSDFDATLRAGSISGVPTGTDIILTVEALDSGKTTVLYQGQTTGITVTSGALSSVTVTMTLASTNLAVTTPSASSPYYSNAVLGTLGGTCADPGNGDVQSITLSLSGQTDLTQSCSSGTFSLDLSSWSGAFTANAAPYVITITQTSTFGGGDSQITWSYIYDTIAPTGGGLSSPSSVTSGTNSITITGACEVGATVTVNQTSPTTTSQSTTCTGAGTYSLSVVRFTDATYALSLSQSDLAGNSESAFASVTWTRDTAIPNAPSTIAVSTPAPVNSTYLASPVSEITVTCLSGHTVKLFENDSTTALNGSGTACTGSAQAIAVSGTGSTDGVYSYSATQTKDSTGVTSSAASVTYTLDQADPSAPGISSPVTVSAGGSGSISTAETTLTISGSCETGATVFVTGGTSPAQTTCASGSYSFVGYAGSAALNSLSITQQDLANNSSLATTLAWTGGATVPATPTITTPASNPYTAKTLATLAGTCTGTNQVSLSGQQSGTTTCGTPGAGQFEFTITDPGSDGSYNYSVKQNDGSFDSATVTLTWVRDNSAAAPSLTKPVTVAAGGTGNHSTGAVNSIAVEGGCEADATVNITGSATKAVTCGPAGTFATSVSAFQDGSYSYTIKQTDLAGNISAATTLNWTRTTVTPSAPTIQVPAQATTYSNVSPTTISGTCTTDYTVVLSGAQSNATTCVSSAFSFTLSALVDDDTYTFLVTQADSAGTTSAAATRTWVYDTLKPAALVLTNPTVTPQVTANATNFLLSGTCETGATVTLSGDATAGEVSPGNSLTQTCTGGQFSYSIAKPAPTGDVTYVFSLNQTDLAGNTSSTLTQTWINTATVPVTPVLDQTSMPIRTDNSTDVTISGTCDGTNDVILDDGVTDLSIALPPATAGSDYPYVDTCSGGTFSISLQNSTNQWNWDAVTGQGSNLVQDRNDGTYNFSLYQVDSVSGVNSAGVFVQVVVDTGTPAAPVITTPSNTGSYAGPGPISIGGTCEAGASVSISGVTLNPPGAVTCSAGGTFSFASVDESVDGLYNYTVKQTDLTGNESPTAPLAWTRDSQLVAPPVITSPTVNPFLSNETALTVIGTCTSGMTVHISDGGGFNTNTACVGGGFAFSLTGSDGDSTTFTLYQEVGGATPGNPGASPEITFTWNIDASIPTLVMVYALPYAVGDASSAVSPLISPAKDAVFEFRKDVAEIDTITFECNEDGSGFSACTSPFVLSGLTGDHNLAIRAKDSAGNFSAVYTRYWTQHAHNSVALYHFDETTNGADAVDTSLYTDGAEPVVYDGSLTATGTTVYTHSGTLATDGFDKGRNIEHDTSDLLNAADDYQLASPRSKLTVEAFVQFDFDSATRADAWGPDDEMIIASKWDTTNARSAWEFGIKRRGGSGTSVGANVLLFFRTYPDDTGVEAEALSSKLQPISGQALPYTSPWTHYAVTFNRGVVTFFQDGVLLGSRTIGVAGQALVADGDGPLYVGVALNDNTPTYRGFLDGRVDELRLSQELCYLTGPGAAPSAPFTGADSECTGQ